MRWPFPGTATIDTWTYARNIRKAERDKKFEKLHKVWAPAALEKILELRGFYIKVGQMAATNIGNAFPDKWVRTMEVLQDNVLLATSIRCAKS